VRKSAGLTQSSASSGSVTVFSQMTPFGST
jgi:hypothetical protein